MYEASDLRKGLKVQINAEPYIVVDFQFTKPGKGQAIYWARLKNMLNGSNLERNYRANDKFEPADILSRQMEYLYFDGHNYCFMDPTTFENHLADEQVVGDNKNYMTENMVVEVLFFGERIIDVTLPPSVVLRITKSEPGVRGDTATNVLKPATLETGAQVQVPLFVNEGEHIRVDTRTGAYVERVKK
jgi:elongation factor P